MKTALLTIGIFAVVIGFVWMGQGAGFIRYPARSFMIDQSPWIWWGAGLALAGAIAAWISRR